MTRTVEIASILALVLSYLPRQSLATGYYLGEQDAVANGRGLAVTAKLLEPSTIFFNPAGLAFLKGLNASVGGTVVLPFFDYSDPEQRRPSASTVKDTITVPHVYASYTFGETAALGIGFNAPFGLSIKWPLGFPGEGLTAATDLKMPTIHIGGAYRPIPRMSIGAALRVVPATVEFLQRFRLATDAGAFGDDTYGFAHLGASAVGVGATVGIQAEPIDGLHLGVSYVSRIKFSFANGEAHFHLPNGMSDDSVFHDQGGAVSMTSPDVLSLGVGYDVLDDLYFEVDFNYTWWSVYRELSIVFDNDPTGQLTQASRSEKKWKDTPTFRVSGQYSPWSFLTFRLGGGYDVNPVPDDTLGPELPDSDRIFVGLGVGYKYEPLGLKLDVAYTLVLFRDRTVTAADGNPFPARYEGTAHLIGFTAGVGWGAGGQEPGSSPGVPEEGEPGGPASAGVSSL